MQSTINQDRLLDAMVLLEVAEKMYPSVDHFFSGYSTSNLIRSAHDLVQFVHSGGKSEIEAETRELLATLEAARKYIDCGGHLWKPHVIGQEHVAHPRQAENLFQRILGRIGF